MLFFWEKLSFNHNFTETNSDLHKDSFSQTKLLTALSIGWKKPVHNYGAFEESKAFQQEDSWMKADQWI